MLNSWGTYPWFIAHGEEKIHIEDLERFKKEAHNCKVFKCIGKDTNYIILEYGVSRYRVKSDLFKIVPNPKFCNGQKVIIKDKNIEVIISDIMWHYDKKEHYYFIFDGHKKKSKRYFEAEITIA